MAFTSGQWVRMLVASVGDDADDVEQTYPPGAAGYIDEIDNRGIHHVVVGIGDRSIVQCFDAGEEAERSMQAMSMPKIRAKSVAYSSIVGSSVMLIDPSGRIVGLLGLREFEGGRAEHEAMAARIAAAINAGQAERQVTHTKSGTTYDVITSEALFQVSNPDPAHRTRKVRHVEDGDPVTVYRNPEGMHFVRFPDEMVSPRFEDVQS